MSPVSLPPLPTAWVWALPPLAWAAALTSHWSSGTRLCTLRDLSETHFIRRSLIKNPSPLATRRQGHLHPGVEDVHTEGHLKPQAG